MTDEDFDAAWGERIVVFLVTRETAAGVESITGSLRQVGERRWSAVYSQNGQPYARSETYTMRARAEAHLAQQRATLEAAGWTQQVIEGA